MSMGLEQHGAGPPQYSSGKQPQKIRALPVEGDQHGPETAAGQPLLPGLASAQHSTAVMSSLRSNMSRRVGLYRRHVSWGGGKKFIQHNVEKYVQRYLLTDAA